jgi:hypothetical protein
MALRQPQDPESRDRLEPVPEADYSLPPVRRLNAEQSRAYFDETARELLGISGDTFIERWHAGRYRDILDDPAHSDIMYLTLLGNIGRTR